MKNIHVLPTKNREISNIGIVNNKLHISKIKEFGQNPQHIYITSDEEIKEGEYGYDQVHNCVVKITKNLLGNYLYKKIILTTDPSLIADGIQPIDDEFLEWFVKNSSCEEVKTIYGLFNPMGRQVDPKNLVQNQSKCVWKYKIIIPKEEPIQEPCCTPIGQIKRYVDCKGCDRKPLQETLEEFINEVTKDFEGEMSIKFTSGGIKLGAKWQAKRMYSEEDIISLIQFLAQDEDFDSYTSVSKETAKYYLERFKVER